MKFVIICPAAKEFRVIGSKKASSRMKIFRFSMLSAIQVAASAPKDVEVEIIDENVEPINFNIDAEIIGISFMTFNAPRAYEIATIFRAKGKVVIFGGYHPTLMPEEASKYCDAICIGDAESNIGKFFEDYKNGRIKKIYAYPYKEFRTLKDNKNLIKNSKYIISSVIQATRGCCHKCEFCSISAFYKQSYKKKPIEDVIEEIKAIKRKQILFIDDNLVMDVNYARRLFEKMIPLNKNWYSQIEVNVNKDIELLNLMKKSGCRGVFVGFESLSQDSLKSAGKSFNMASFYKEAVKKFHERGIGVLGAFVLGLDYDKKDIFNKTLNFLKEAKIDALQLTVLTPFPGTPLFMKMDKEKRIFDKNWENYDLSNVVIKPANMTVEELTRGYRGTLKEFYSWSRIISRSLKQFLYLRPMEILYFFLTGIGYRYKLKKRGYI